MNLYTYNRASKIINSRLAIFKLFIICGITFILSALIDQFICMQLSKEQSQQIKNNDPFIIIHNYRSRTSPSDPSIKTRRVPHDYTLDRKSIILTRKMKAELQEKVDPGEPQQNSQTEQKEQKSCVEKVEQNNEFFNENQLQKGIPMSEYEDEDILYNLNEMSWASNYSKLEKTLLGLNFTPLQKEQQQEQKNICQL